MSDKEIVEIMIAKVEEIVRSKVKEDFNEAKTLDKKNVAKAIIKELEQVMQDEKNKKSGRAADPCGE